jgi:argininosuccinate lyase
LVERRAEGAVDRPGARLSVHRLWGGRFSVPPAPALDDLNRSLDIDSRLWREDIEASRAWAEALARANVVSSDEAAALDRGLVAVEARLANGIPEGAKDEDIHTLVERLLYEEAGDVAGKLHTGRSRNDQAATDTRLWALRAAGRLDAEVRGLEGALLAQARANIDLLIPAYTHLRRAQPVRVAHWLMAQLWAFERDRARLADALVRVAVLPLGSGAISGCGFPVDRSFLMERLGFKQISPNSLDAVGDRDWMCEIVFVCALVGTHLSRLAEDLILYSSDEFGFVKLPEAYTTGSSLMPQKRNPDGLELARGKAARLVGDVASALALLKGLPSAYNKDMQEDKALLFSALDAVFLTIPATRETVAGLVWQKEGLQRALDDEAILATDLADELVRRGVPFREAHGAIGRLLRAADTAGVSLHELPPEEWVAAHQAFASGIPELSPERSVENRAVAGATARSAVLAQFEAATSALA